MVQLVEGMSIDIQKTINDEAELQSQIALIRSKRVGMEAKRDELVKRFQEMKVSKHLFAHVIILRLTIANIEPHSRRIQHLWAERDRQISSKFTNSDAECDHLHITRQQRSSSIHAAHYVSLRTHQ